MAGPPLDGLVNPEILLWARKTARLNLSEAAEKATVNPERLASWEAGAATPTLTQLRKLANVYKRGVPVFFLKAVPTGTRQPVDYRRVELRTKDTVSPALSIAIREASAKRDSALELFADLEDEPPIFKLKCPPGASAELLGEYLTKSLRLPVSARTAWRTKYDALAGWRAAAESAGVLVMQVSDVDTDEMRGCSLAFDPLPVVLLNSSDSPLGRVFTLLHELAHLSRAESGLCDMHDAAGRQAPADDEEVFCNRAAGAAMIPGNDLLSMPAVALSGARSDWSEDALNSMSSRFWASREVVLRRLLTFDRTSASHYQEWRHRFAEEAVQARATGTGGFVPYPRKVVLRNGRFLTALALNAYEASAITGSELSRLLGAKLDHLPGIVEIVRGTGAE